jgi:hypothetical protein
VSQHPPFEHVEPAQQAWPAPPHCEHVSLPPHASPAPVHERPGQHGWPAPPHCAQTPLLHALPELH